MTTETTPEPDPRGRIQTLNPAPGRRGVSVRAELYRTVRRAILDAVTDAPDGVPLARLSEEVERRTAPALWATASVGWYTMAVKLDLEARGLLERSGSPQRLHPTDLGRSEPVTN